MANPQDIVTLSVELSQAERERYQLAKTRAINAMNYYNNQPICWLLSKKVDFYRLFNAIRMSCVIPIYTFDFQTDEQLQGLSNLIEDLVKKQREEKCPICLTEPPNRISDCGHTYCKDCIERWIDTHDSCPVCRNNLIMHLVYSPSSKSSYLLEDLKSFKRRSQHKTAKAVILSQYNITLFLMNGALKGANFKSLHCMQWSNEVIANFIESQEVIANFIESRDHLPVLLLNLQDLHGDINLPPHSIVYIMDACTKTVERHILNRVVGHEESIRVVRMVAQNTVEERIPALEQKRTIFSEQGQFLGQNFEKRKEICALLQD